MPAYTLPKLSKPRRLRAKQVLLVASGDLRESANRVCWAAQAELEAALTAAVRECGYEVVRAHSYNEQAGHGFLASQAEGMRVFADLDRGAKLIVAEAVWQYSHHVLAGLIAHRGPILTVANWSGQWPGLVGMLNLNGSLTKAGVKYSTLWAEDLSDPEFVRKLKTWLQTGKVTHRLTHVTPLTKVSIPARERKLGQALAAQLLHDQAVMGVFDEGCMGMYNAIIPDHLLHAVGVHKERLSQSALYYATTQVPDREAEAVFDWLCRAGMQFKFGASEETDLTRQQVLTQCKMYVAALRLADEFGCHCIGIQYQQGLKDCLPASDLVEGMLNNTERPPVMAAGNGRVLYAGEPLPHFNEVDECAGLDGLLTYRVHRAMGQPVENTLHDVRWGDWDHSGTTDEYVWVFEISGSVPPAHLVGGWAGAVGERQPAMYFRLGGSTIKGVSRPGEIVWSRIYVEDDRLNLDVGRAGVVELPPEETRRRWEATTSQWPIMHAVLYGVTRDQFMAKHKANHVQVAYAHSAADADKALLAKAACTQALGIKVNVCGTRRGGRPWAAASH
ncbi:MAG TPA: fucose isomerase [Phycisphaerae bacterium]|nr:fucose isomerase [Phycisphaerae bacterium]HNU46414.1 fucose isomerase [Phycisphaerae bacterium]